jgi:thioredoxin 1
MIAYVTNLNPENYTDFTKKDGLVLVDIHAVWCGPCRVIGPIVDEFSNKFQNKVSVGKLNADDSGNILTELGVRNIPTIIIYKDGEILEKIVGLTSLDKLSESVDPYLNQ